MAGRRSARRRVQVMVVPLPSPPTPQGEIFRVTRRAGPVFTRCSVSRHSFGTTTKTPGAFLRASTEGVKHRDVLSKFRVSCLASRKKLAPARLRTKREQTLKAPPQAASAWGGWGIADGAGYSPMLCGRAAPGRLTTLPRRCTGAGRRRMRSMSLACASCCSSSLL